MEIPQILYKIVVVIIFVYSSKISSSSWRLPPRPLVPTRSPTSLPTMPEQSDSPTLRSRLVIPSSTKLQLEKSKPSPISSLATFASSKTETTLEESASSSTSRNTKVPSILSISRIPRDTPSLLDSATLLSSVKARNLGLNFPPEKVSRKLSSKRERESSPSELI